MRRPGYSRKFKTIGSVHEFDLNVILINFLETGFELEAVDASNDCKIAFYKGKGKKRKMAIAPCTSKKQITLTNKPHLKSAPLSSPYGNAAKRTKPVSLSCCRKKWYLPEQQPMPMVSSPASTSLHRFVCLGRNGQQRNNYSEKATLKLTLQSDSKAVALSQWLLCSNNTNPKPGESCWHSPSLVSHFVHERKRIPWFQGAVGNPLKLSAKTSWDQCKIAF